MLEAATLKSSYLVAGLSDDQIAEVAKLAEIHNYPSGHLLCRIGDPANDLYVIIGGSLAVTTHDGDKLGEIGTNSIVGEIAIVDVRQRSANVTCVGPVTAAAISVDALRKLMNENRQWGFLILANVARVMSVRLRQADARIDELADKAADVWDHCQG
jgi:CRP-like cAMP-binding protein